MNRRMTAARAGNFQSRALMYTPMPAIRLCSLIAILLLGAFGCSSQEERFYPVRSASLGGGSLQLPVAEQNYDEESTARVGTTKPWESWPLGVDLSGAPLRSPLLIEGDNRAAKGDYRGASEAYLKAPIATMSPSEVQAAALRVAGAQLALGNSREALRALSSYFVRSGKGSEEVDARSSLLFAHAYRMQGDTEQALAWFSRLYRLSDGGALLGDAARRGAVETLQALPPQTFARIAPLWESDGLLRGLIGEERRRRTDGGEVVPQTPAQAVVQSPQTPGASFTVGVLLPLSGKFERLGRSSKQGMELAFESFPHPHSLNLKFLDTADDVQQAVGQALAASGDPAVSLVVGPLIAEHAQAVREVLAGKDLPLIALSKSSDFHPGGLAFRFGPTARSQVDSLLQSVMDVRRLQRFAIVYPGDPSGEEFADLFRAAVAERRGTIVYEKRYTRGNETDLLVAAQEIELTDAQGVFVPDAIVRASRLFSNLSRNARKRITPLGIALWDELAALNQSRAVMNGAVVVSAFDGGSSDEKIQRFNALYKERFGESPDFLAAQGFDTASILLTAFGPGASSDLSVERGLVNAPIVYGLTGRIAVESDGEFSRAFAVLEYRDGKLHPLEPEVDPLVADVVEAGDAVAREVIVERGDGQPVIEHQNVEVAPSDASTIDWSVPSGRTL